MAVRISSKLLASLIAEAPPVADPINVSPGFLKLFTDVEPGEGFFGVYRLGAGESAVYRVTRAEALAPLLRVRINSRSVHVEMRRGGGWRSVDRFETPRTAQAWTRLAKRILAESALPSRSWDWRGTGNENETRTDTTCDVAHPKLGGGKVTRGARKMPNQTLTWGWAPARGNRAATHNVPSRCVAGLLAPCGNDARQGSAFCGFHLDEAKASS